MVDSAGHPHAGGEISGVASELQRALGTNQAFRGACQVDAGTDFVFSNQNGLLSGSLQLSAMSEIPEISISLRPVFPSGPNLSTT